MPSVSIVITTYNRVQLLQRAIQSSQQAASDAEVIVVDDCSTDDTQQSCAKLPNIKYVRLNSNRGLAHARNAGIAESSSEFITFLDDDDLRLPDSLNKQLQLLTADDRAAFCYGQALIGDARRQLPTGEVYPAACPQGDIFWQLLEDNFIPMPSVLARKSILLEQGCFNAQLHLIEDWDMWLRLSEHSPVIAIEEPVAIHRKAIAESNQMCSDSAALCKQALRVQEMALKRSRAQVADKAKRRYVRRKFRDRAYKILITQAGNSFHGGDIRSARAHLLDAFRVALR